MAAELAAALGIDVDAAGALLAAADGDCDTAIAIHVGYNGGELPEGMDLGAVTEAQSAERGKEGDPEALRAAAHEAAGGVIVPGAGVDLIIRRTRLLSPPETSKDNTKCGTDANQTAGGAAAATGGESGALWLGSASAAQSAEWLAQTGVSTVITVMKDLLELPSGHFEQIHVAVADDNVDSLRPHLRDTCGTIHQRLMAGGSVLIHCSSGVSRSPTVVIAYFMLHRDLSLKDAYARVITARRCICPGTTFFHELQLLEAELTGVEEPSLDMAGYYAYKVQELAGIPLGPGPRYEECVAAVRAHGWETNMAVLSAAQMVAP